MERPLPPPQSGKKSISECSTDRCNELIANLSQSTTVQRLLRSIASFGPTPIISCLDCTNNNIGINTTTRAVLFDSTPLQILVRAHSLLSFVICEQYRFTLIHQIHQTYRQLTCTHLPFLLIYRSPANNRYVPMWLANRKWRKRWCMNSSMPLTTPPVGVISIHVRVWRIQVITRTHPFFQHPCQFNTN